MTKISEATIAKLQHALRLSVIPLVYAVLVACGGSSSSGPTYAPPAPSAVVDCRKGATARDGTAYTDKFGAPDCHAHLLAEVNNLQASGDIPSNARGVAFIFDYFFDPEDDDDQLEILNAGGLDGNGNYFLTTETHARLDASHHGSEVRRTYNVFSPVLPAGIMSIELRNTGTSANPDFEFFFSGEQLRLAYAAARNNNPLVTGSQASSPYQAHKAIYNYSLSGSHALLLDFAQDLASLSAFEARNNFAEIPTGIIGVGALGNSFATWNTGFRKESGGLLAAGYFVDDLDSNTLAARIDDLEDNHPYVDGVYWDSVELDTDLSDLIASTSTAQLKELVNHNSWRTPADLISSIFPNISGGLATKVSEAGQTRLNLQDSFEVSLLDLLAGATVHARTGHYYTAAYFRPPAAGEGHFFNTHCGVLRDGCFLLPFYQSPRGAQGTSFAAPRLTAIIDTIWLIWPNLTHLSLHRLLRTCTVDLGDPGVDPVFGQGLLDLECLVQPSGGLRVATAQVTGIAGALIGPSTSDTSLATQDAFGRHFDYTAVRTNTNARSFNPLENAHVHTPSQSTVLTVSHDNASAWVSYSLVGDLSMSLGAVYEQDSLLGTYGTGHFQIQDGYSSGARLDWIHRLEPALEHTHARCLLQRHCTSCTPGRSE